MNAATLKFAVGDRVLVDANEMISHPGEIGVVDEVIRNTHVIVKFEDELRVFHVSWLTLAVPPDPAWDEYDQEED